MGLSRTLYAMLGKFGTKAEHEKVMMDIILLVSVGKHVLE